jgi:V/A-type H+-transporting ATPase subunit D
VEEALPQAYAGFLLAGAGAHPAMLTTALMLPKKQLEIEVSHRNQMNVTVPDFFLPESDRKGGDCLNYGLAATSGELDGAIAVLGRVGRDMLRMAQLEKEAQLLAEEIERTRRRVNALEHILMPRYLEAIRRIRMKLDENERGNITRLMKVKDMMVAAQYEKKHQFFPDEEE